MRIQLAEARRHSSGRRPLTRTCLFFAVAAAVLGAGACAQTPVTKPESRLGGHSANDAYRWNGSGTRQTYASKDLDAVNRQGAPGAAVGAVGSGDTILFASDSTELTPETKAILDGFAGEMRTKSVRALSIEGHADERGSDEYNLALGERRATQARPTLLA